MEEIMEMDSEPPALLRDAGIGSGPESGLTGLLDGVIGQTFGRPWGGFATRKSTKPSFPLNPRSAAFLAKHYPHAKPGQWNDWRWQLKHRVTSLDELERMLVLSEAEREALRPDLSMLPMAATPYYLSLVDTRDAHDPLRRCVIPTMAEHRVLPCEQGDPLAEEHDSPAPGLVHRYPDRVLFLATDFCSTYCRYCTRSRRVGQVSGHGQDQGQGGPARWEPALRYIARNPVVRDVLISGGDPLTMTDHALEYLLQRLRAIPHVEIIRIGTKIPMVLPQRVTTSLVQMLKRYHPLFVSIHCTHAEELTPEAALACSRLADAGIPLGGQTVLLQGVNDSVPALAGLFQGLLRNRVRPYYLYQCDQVVGTSHFRTPVSRGLEMIQGLRGHTSGYAVPHFVVDLPGGGGKTPLCPEYLQGRVGEDLVFRNFEGATFRVHDPEPFASRESGGGA
jgi:lysine 2,3-aminomutase